MNERKRHVCPKCGGTKFDVTAHVAQSWVVDAYGDFLETISECDEIDHEPDNDDIWDCSECHYSAVGREFLKEVEEIKTLSVPDGAENDRLWVRDNEVVAICYNPDGNDGNGLFEEHHFNYFDVLKAYCESKGDRDLFIDLLYGNAFKCPTYCIAAGTEAFNEIVEKWDTGIETTPDTLVNTLVDTALTIELAKAM